MAKTIKVSDRTYKKIKDLDLPIIGETGVKEEKKTKIQIKTFGGEVLFESTKSTLKEAVEDAVLEGADLKGAYLEGADLKGADLKGADLKGAYLKGADLKGAYLKGADLKGAYLKGADLKGADFYHVKFFGKGGDTKIGKSQINDFLEALGVIVVK